MIPRGEVGLIFAEIGRVNGIQENDIYAVLIFILIVTTIVPLFFSYDLLTIAYLNGPQTNARFTPAVKVSSPSINFSLLIRTSVI